MSLRRKYFVLFFAVTSLLCAQEIMPLEDAIKLALEKNYDIRTARNTLEIAKLQNNPGNAGLSPTISLNGNLSTANLNSYQVFNTGVVQDRAGATNFGTGASINADWIIFDGFRMFAIRKRLSLAEKATELEQKSQMENTIAQVIAAYYNIVRNNELIKAAKQNLLLCEERRKIAEVRLEIGSDSKVDMLLAQSDENRARAAIMQFELDLLNSKTELNIALGRSAESDFRVADTILIKYEPALDELKKSVPTSNSSLLFSQQNELIAEQSLREARSGNLPFVTVSGAYLFTRNQSQAGFVFLNRQTGFNAGMSARWIIFNGGRNNRLVKERNLLLLNQRLFTEQATLQVNGLVYVNYQRLALNKKIAEIEQLGVRDSRDLQLISLERYKIGKSSVLETIETQKNLEDAQVRYINALYNSKLAETELLRVNGQLVK